MRLRDTGSDTERGEKTPEVAWGGGGRRTKAEVEEEEEEEKDEEEEEEEEERPIEKDCCCCCCCCCWGALSTRGRFGGAPEGGAEEDEAGGTRGGTGTNLAAAAAAADDDDDAAGAAAGGKAPDSRGRLRCLEGEEGRGRAEPLAGAGRRFDAAALNVFGPLSLLKGLLGFAIEAKGFAISALAPAIVRISFRGVGGGLSN